MFGLPWKEKKLSDTAQELFPIKADFVTREQKFWEIYNAYLPKKRSTRFDLVEIGVFWGESIKVFAEHYFNARILGLDLKMNEIDFSKYKNVSYETCDQANKTHMIEVVSKFSAAPDIIIDDASHIGSLTLSTFQTLFPLLKNGGLYIIEDWMTGYRDDWADGKEAETHRTREDGGFTSHDYGMVGVIKQIIDYIDINNINNKQWAPDEATAAPPVIESLMIHRGQVIIVKGAEEIKIHPD